MTETITHFALRRIANGDGIYSCLPNITIDQDERGCLVINENEISERLVTNDLVTPIDAQSFRWNGRFDNVVNSAGIKLFPESLEKQIEPLISENRYYFRGRKSVVFGEELVLFIEGEKPINWTEITLKMKQILKPFEYPKEIIFVPQFNETATGKVMRTAF
jgi:O-succinylbenzoic acid--CoA ligase